MTAAQQRVTLNLLSSSRRPTSASLPPTRAHPRTGPKEGHGVSPGRPQRTPCCPCALTCQSSIDFPGDSLTHRSDFANHIEFRTVTPFRPPTGPMACNIRQLCRRCRHKLGHSRSLGVICSPTYESFARCSRPSSFRRAVCSLFGSVTV